MDVFLSWSGARGRSVAEAIGTWLPRLHEGLTPWVSSRQKRGVDWRVALFEHVSAADAGVLCLTSDSLASRWLAFEAGMLSRRAGAPLVVYALDMDADELSGTPFARMPVFEATEAGTLALARVLNGTLPHPVLDADLHALVAATWPLLEFHLGNVPPRDTRPLELIVLVPGVTARYELVLPTDERWSVLLDQVREALTDQYGIADTDLRQVDYFDLDSKRWIETPRRLSDVGTSRLVAVHPDMLPDLGGSRSTAQVTIAFQLDQHPREARANALLRRDLLDLAREQQAYRAREGTYATHVHTLAFFTATDGSIEIVEATDAGWCAVGSHPDLRFRLGIRAGQTVTYSDKGNEIFFV